MGIALCFLCTQDLTVCFPPVAQELIEDCSDQAVAAVPRRTPQDTLVEKHWSIPTFLNQSSIEPYGFS